MHIQVVQFCAEFLKITCTASIICVPFLVDIWFCRSSISGIITIPYIATARGSPRVVPSVQVKTVLLTYRFEGCLYELPAHDVVPNKDFLLFRASSLLSELKAFSASKSSMACVSGFSNSLLELWIAYSIPHFWPKQSWKFFPILLRSDFIHWVIVLPIILLRDSPIPMGRTPGFLSRDIKRHELYAVRFSLGRTLVVIV